TGLEGIERTQGCLCVTSVKEQKLLYHLTPLKNLEGIINEGLKSRSQLDNFEDIADHEILQKRSDHGLENFVPFHWFARNPFDGGIQAAISDKYFVIFTVKRALAKNLNWKVIPRHPLANDRIELMNYTEGFDSIDWEAMNLRDYHNPYSKSVCMAECLSPTTVLVDNFFNVFVPDVKVENYVQKKCSELGIQLKVDINEHMFLK
ncbi:MAG: DarT ssDNA thymidine ADP-ribosyltransferase family protein, partial [Methylobacter sp.]|nr:DarT ssDNA thymidine ADP-ribosyltransferase family protein [Candidatus Methylobacter titanis]